MTTRTALFSELARECTHDGCGASYEDRVGKFQNEDVSTFHAYHVSLDGLADEEFSHEGFGWFARVGNVIIQESDNGFVSGIICRDDGGATRRFDELRAESEFMDSEE